MSKPTIPPEIAARIDGYVDKYMKILKIAGERPSIKIRNDPKANWLGRTEWRTERPHTSVLELQKRLFKSDKHLERTIAHEMVHHRDFLALTDDEIARIEAGTVPDEPKKHSASFSAGALRINAIKGSDFVVKEEEPEELPAYLLPVQAGRSSTKLLLVLGFGGVAFLGALLLSARSQRAPEPRGPRRGPGAQSARGNERGRYGG